MSSNGNDEVKAFLFLIAMFGVVVYYALLIVAVVVIVGALALTAFMTFVALVALVEPVRLGDVTVERDGAIGFLARGAVGVVAGPLFVALVSFVFDHRVDWDRWELFSIVGYILCSVGVEILIELAKEEEAHQSPPSLPEPSLPALPPTRLKQIEARPFRYASWDDEEARQ